MDQLRKFSLRLKNTKSSASKRQHPQAPESVSSSPAAAPQKNSDLESTASTPKSSSTGPLAHQPKPTESDKAPRDLWQEALNHLDEETRSPLKLEGEQTESCVTNAIQAVVTNVEVLFEEYSNGGRKIKDGDGRITYDVRENGKKVLRFALRTKAIKDSGVKFDPTGYYQELLGVTELEDRLRVSYEAILAFVAMVKKQQDQGFLGRVWYTIYSLSEAPLQQLKDSILSSDNTTEQWRQLIEHEFGSSAHHEQIG
ncbi:hypothetical protein N7488_002378 [Penicillium malachiteum]|nr:hypothetical protein N7488_002378 [Penicillium malachiteum]